MQGPGLSPLCVSRKQSFRVHTLSSKETECTTHCFSVSQGHTKFHLGNTVCGCLAAIIPRFPEQWSWSFSMKTMLTFANVKGGATLLSSLLRIVLPWMTHWTYSNSTTGYETSFRWPFSKKPSIWCLWNQPTWQCKWNMSSERWGANHLLS